jgi:hypothetical protein
MKLFCVTKRTLDLGFGDAPPEWSRMVRANNSNEIWETLRLHNALAFIRIEEVSGIDIGEFSTFLRSLPPVDDSRQVTDEEVQELLGGSLL